MKLERFKERNNKRIGIIIFTIVCILLVGGVILYRTFAVFEVKTNQNVIKGNVQDPGNLYFAFYQKNEENGEYEIKKDVPNLSDGYVLDEVQSYCGVSGEKDTDIEVYLSEDGYIKVKGMKTSRTKCNLYFTKGVFIKGKGIPVVTSGDGLYKVEHPATETEGMDEGWRTEEYRYAGNNPNNYIWFNDELWRIIGLVNVKVDKGNEQTAIEQRLKIIKDTSIGKYSWDKDATSGTNDWTQSSLMKMLNGIYYEHQAGDCYRYNGSSNSIADRNCDFTQTGMKDKFKNVIASDIIWNIGGWDVQKKDPTIIEMYSHERGSETAENHPYEWSSSNTIGNTSFHSIGLFYPSDVGYATSKRECIVSTSISGGGVVSPWFKPCLLEDWMFHDQWIWAITPTSRHERSVYRVDNRGFITDDSAIYDTPYDVYPTIYLKNDVIITSGTGTSEDAFRLELK